MEPEGRLWQQVSTAIFCGCEFLSEGPFLSVKVTPGCGAWPPKG